MDKEFTATYKTHSSHFTFAGGSDRECRHSIHRTMKRAHPTAETKEIIIKKTGKRNEI